MKILKLSLFVYIFIVYNLFSSEIVVQIKSNQWKVSQYLVGLHFIYSKELDCIYKDKKIALWAKNSNINIARFPGGTVVKGWDWRHPLGRGYKSDPWNPKNTYSVSPESQWMSLDEYLDFIKVSGMTPLLGVNYTSGILYHREKESIKRAAEMVQYVKSRGFSGAYYYIGNEDIHIAGGIKSAAKAFAEHAKAMKVEDPTIKIFWNDNHVNPKRLKKYLAIAGKWADGCEFHGKWPYGGKWKKDYYSLKDWQSQNPIRGAKYGVYSKRIKKLRKAAIQAGYSKLLFANNEYGLNHHSKLFTGFNRFTKSLVVIDYLQNLFIGGYDMAAFWSNVGNDSFLMDKNFNYKMNPMSIGFQMIAEAQGKIMLKTVIENSMIRGFAVKSNSKYIIFLLNKSNKSEEITIRLKDLPVYKRIKLKGNRLVDTSSHWGKLEVITNLKNKNNIIKTILPSLTYSKITVTID